jgi:hypothetical protein
MALADPSATADEWARARAALIEGLRKFQSGTGDVRDLAPADAVTGHDEDMARARSLLAERLREFQGDGDDDASQPSSTGSLASPSTRGNIPSLPPEVPDASDEREQARLLDPTPLGPPETFEEPVGKATVSAALAPSTLESLPLPEPVTLPIVPPLPPEPAPTQSAHVENPPAPSTPQHIEPSFHVSPRPQQMEPSPPEPLRPQQTEPRPPEPPRPQQAEPSPPEPARPTRLHRETRPEREPEPARPPRKRPEPATAVEPRPIQRAEEPARSRTAKPSKAKRIVRTRPQQDVATTGSLTTKANRPEPIRPRRAMRSLEPRAILRAPGPPNVIDLPNSLRPLLPPAHSAF